MKPKFHFYFGADAIPVDKLKHLVKASEPHMAHTVAWSNETGVGILYFVKDSEQKDSPQGALSLVSSLDS
jgi:Pleckstrin homology domain